VGKYVKVEPDAVKVRVEREHGRDVLELSMAQPGKGGG
jgi:septum formation topological specificity factor MinE